MNDLIQVTPRQIGDRSTQTVNARDLHTFLENRDHFSTWIKDRVEQYAFVEGHDFTTYSENSGKGRPRIDYHLSLDMAKELAMVERNDKGKQARLYFIECERRAKAPPAAAAPEPDLSNALEDPGILRRVLLGYTEKVIALQQTVQEQAPKVEAFERLQRQTEGSFCLTDAAKLLQLQPRKFVARLQQLGWIYRRPMGSGWLAYSERITMGLLEHKVTSGDKADGTEWASTQVRVTTKGLARLALIVNQEATKP